MIMFWIRIYTGPYLHFPKKKKRSKNRSLGAQQSSFSFHHSQQSSQSSHQSLSVFAQNAQMTLQKWKIAWQAYEQNAVHQVPSRNRTTNHQRASQRFISLEIFIKVISRTLCIVDAVRNLLLLSHTPVRVGQISSPFNHELPQGTNIQLSLLPFPPN